MTFGADVITGLITSLAYDGIRRPFRALTDAQSRRRALASHKESTTVSRPTKIIDEAVLDLIKYIAHDEGGYTKETATFLHELSKTSIPDNIKLLVASGRDPEPLFPDFCLVYDLFKTLPFEKRRFFDLFCTAIETRFKESIDSRVILDAINGRGIEILSRLDAIGSNVNEQKIESYTYNDFSDDRLRVAKAIEASNKYITVETNAGAKKFTLSRMVVPARLTEVSDASEIPLPHRETSRHHSSSINIITFRRSFYNAVILGDPGGGKTTLTQHVCHSLSQQIILESGNPLDSHFDARDLKLPLRIILRRYEARVRSDPRYNLLDYLKDDLRPQFSNADDRAMAFINHLLKTGQAVLIFDGLDEVLDISTRRDIVSMVEGFSHQFPACPCLVTSRIVGYADAPMSAEFKIFTLSRFSNLEIKKYATNFLKAISGESKEVVSKKVSKFLAESASNAADLRENPLLLGLMIYIFNARGDVPNNRPEIYRECSLLMFEKWDQRRDIRFNVPNDFYLVDLFSFLASKIFGDSNAEEGVDAAWLEKALRQYFDAWYEDKAKSVVAARTLVDFITGRAWVMCEIGPGVYKFTHRTFLEYFFARRVEEEAGSVKLLVADHIFPRATRAQWDVVTHLALQIATFRSGPKSRQALYALMDQLSSHIMSDSERVNYLHFIIRAIDYLVISEIETARVCSEICNQILLLEGQDPSEVADLFYSLLSLRGAASEISPSIVSDSLKDAIISNDHIRYSNAIYVLGARLAGFRGYSQGSSGPYDFGIVWRKTSAVRACLKDYLYKGSDGDIDRARSYYYVYRDKVAHLLSLHGLEFLLPSPRKKTHHDEDFCAFFSVLGSLCHSLKVSVPIATTTFELSVEDAGLIYRFMLDKIINDRDKFVEALSRSEKVFTFEFLDSYFEIFIYLSRNNKGLMRRIPEFSSHLAVLLVIRNAMQLGLPNDIKSSDHEESLAKPRYGRIYDGLPNALRFFSDKAGCEEISKIINMEGEKLSYLLCPDI